MTIRFGTRNCRRIKGIRPFAQIFGWPLKTAQRETETLYIELKGG